MHVYTCARVHSDTIVQKKVCTSAYKVEPESVGQGKGLIHILLKFTFFLKKQNIKIKKRKGVDVDLHVHVTCGTYVAILLKLFKK